MHGYKRRNWMAYLSVSASGPNYSTDIEETGVTLRPREVADLRYTTADIDFLERLFREPNYDSGEVEFHKRLLNPTVEQFFDALTEIRIWLKSFRDEPNWDGGGIQLCFAGHGCKRNGAIVLTNGAVEPSVFMDALRITASEVSLPGRLRISAILDSCYSGAFITSLLHECLKGSLVIPFHLIASCMEDEVAWEESSLGHGVFTYSFSVKHEALFGLAAKAIQPDNTYGPSLSIAHGTLGCSLLTGGAQNPILYWNGCGEIEIGEESMSILDHNGHLVKLDHLQNWLKTERDKISMGMKQVQPNRSLGRGTSS